MIDGPYLEGERAMIKVKRARTADFVVGGFRYARDWFGVAPTRRRRSAGWSSSAASLTEAAANAEYSSVDRGERTI